MVHLGDFADCREHFLQMPTPACWIITRPETTHRRPRQYALDPATSARGGFGLCFPDWLQHLDDVRSADVINRKSTDHWQHVLLNAGAPLSAMLGILPAAFV